jgi:tetratricopeptide (TPR) repeat protein
MLKAIGQFRLLVDKEGIENGYLFYNIGNAYYEAGEKGKAILYYRKAERLVPGFSDLQFNLIAARQELKTPEMRTSAWTEIVKSVFFWHYMFDYSTRRNVSITAFIGFWVMLTGLIFIRSLLLRAAVVISIVVTIAMGGSYLASAYELNLVTSGVIIQQQAEVRKGPGLSYETVYEQPLPEGTEFELMESQGNWWKVRLVNRDEVWIKASAAEIV